MASYFAVHFLFGLNVFVSRMHTRETLFTNVWQHTLYTLCLNKSSQLLFL